MKIAILASQSSKQEILDKGIAAGVEILWCGSVKILVATVADVYMDLLFVPDRERTERLAMRVGMPFFINSVADPGINEEKYFVRINAWPGFLQREYVELVANGGEQKRWAEQLFDVLGWKYQVVPNIPGMISARIVSCIVNEAYYTFGDGISSKQEIDTAMKLGTSYPYGPFEWAEKIGLDRIYSLLLELQKTDERYKPAPALEREVLAMKAQ
jgi:3-hydroxybutyryl-CoA dehydrogenase